MLCYPATNLRVKAVISLVTLSLASEKHGDIGSVNVIGRLWNVLHISMCVCLCMCVSYSVVIGLKNILVRACVFINFNRNNCST